MKISKNLLIEPDETLLIFSELNRPVSVHIVKTALNTDVYNGFRVMITDGYYTWYPVRYSNGSIFTDNYKAPKYVQNNENTIEDQGKINSGEYVYFCAHVIASKRS